MHEQLTEWWDGVSLRNKITGVTVMLLTLGLLVAGVGTMSMLRTYLLDGVETKISEAIDLTSLVRYDQTTPALDCVVQRLPPEYYLAVISPSGRLLCDNKEPEEAQPLLTDLSLAEIRSRDTAFTLYNEERTSQWRVVAYLPPQPNVTHIVGVNLDDTNAVIARYVGIFLFFGLSVVVLGGALTRLLVTSTFQPLREVEETAARFAAGDFSQRLGGATPNTEVGRLNESLNTMLNRIDRAFSDRAKTIDQMRRFVGDASHELRTPLVSVRGYAELYRMGALGSDDEVAQAMERIEKEAIRMGGLVEDLLELARIDEAKPLDLAPVDLVALANDAALDTMASAPGRQVSVIVDEIIDVDDAGAEPEPEVPVRNGAIAFAGATFARLRARRPRRNEELTVQTLIEERPVPDSALVLADENKMRQVITNLMGNAIRFTPAGDPIEIRVTIDHPQDSVVLSVIDHGEGIPPQIREKIFQRFWRADNSRNRDTGGSGLGLAIVASLVASHKGTVDAVETPGGGATFRVRLPLLHEEPADETAPSETEAE